MERLTYDFCICGVHCWQVKGADNLECREVCEMQKGSGCKTCPIAKAFDRLAAYEDTGLAPEEVQQMRWIPVEERLPEKQGEYIVFADGKVTTDMYIVCDEIERWLHYDGSLNEFYIDPYSSKPTREPPYPKVTHWMPLPQPPKEEAYEK